MFRLGFAWLLLVATGHSAVLYSLRDARFFGTDPGRETLESGAFLPSSVEDLPVNYTTGGGTPAAFDGLATTQGSPFRLGAYNHVNAAAATSLTLNTDLVTPTLLVSLVQSRITASVTVTGGSGTGYLLPTFRIQGTFADNHTSAFGNVTMCAGISSCSLSGVATSTGGTQNIDTLFTPLIASNTSFTFGTPFSLFFFVSAGVSSLAPGTLNAGEVTVDLSNGVELVDLRVVDENGVLIRGALIDSDLVDILNTPEPGTWGLIAMAVVAMGMRRGRLVTASTAPRSAGWRKYDKLPEHLPEVAGTRSSQ